MTADTELTRFIRYITCLSFLTGRMVLVLLPLGFRSLITKGAYTASGYDRGEDFVTVNVDINGSK
jgi:hypothetical protein